MREKIARANVGWFTLITDSFSRRSFLAVASSATLAAGCTSTTSSGSLTQSVAASNRNLQAAILVGAGLGFAVARARGGSAIAGLALGAFAGATVSAAISYARALLAQNNNNIGPSFVSMGDAANSDTETFLNENVPLISEREALISGLERNSRSIRLSTILARLEALEELERRRTIPTNVYGQAAPIYPQCVLILPREAGLNQTPRSDRPSADYAKKSADANVQITSEYIHRNNRTIARAAEMGIRIT